jgi:molybdopterin adenylyltransferase
MSFRIALLVLSDSGASGRRKDEVIPAVEAHLAGSSLELARSRIIPDDREIIERELRAFVNDPEICLVLTAGGTGMGARDNTPEATRAVITREAPGLAELLRLRGLTHTPRAMLTRGVAGTAERTLIINLPGSPRAVREGLDALLPILPHALETLLGLTRECARNEDGAPGVDRPAR